jgi:hypothetical protein
MKTMQRYLNVAAQNLYLKKNDKFIGFERPESLTTETTEKCQNVTF